MVTERETQEDESEIALGKRTVVFVLVALYCVLLGSLGLVWSSLDIRYGDEEYHQRLDQRTRDFEDEGLVHRVCMQVLYYTSRLGLVIGGVGMFLRKGWAATLLLVAIPVNGLFDFHAFAIGLGGGMPAGNDYTISWLVVGSWNLLLFSYVYWRRTWTIWD